MNWEITVDDKIEAILIWAQSNPRFDTTFVHNVRAWIDSGKQLTDAQERGIDNIIDKWEIDV